MGVMGYRTPNIDRIAEEGMIFTDYYGEQSCTAGRSSFITGQSVFRTGLSKVGMPGAEQGMQTEDPTIAALLKAEGYATGQFGKNHLGDRDEHSCRPITASTSSSAISTTSTPRKSRRTRTIPPTPPSASASARAA
jgi:arylsulfatase A-like enzyme